MNTKYKRLISLLVMTVLLLGIFNMAKANTAREEIGYPIPLGALGENGTLEIRLEYQGTLDTRSEESKAEVNRYGDPTPEDIEEWYPSTPGPRDILGTQHLGSVTILEQSTYADKQPNHKYYKTVGYQVALLNDELGPVGTGFANIEEDPVTGIITVKRDGMEHAQYLTREEVIEQGIIE